MAKSIFERLGSEHAAVISLLIKIISVIIYRSYNSVYNGKIGVYKLGRPKHCQHLLRFARPFYS